MIPLSKATEKQKADLFDDIFKRCVENLSQKIKADVVGDIIELFDNLDNDDALGTEGWQHRLGLKD